MSRAPLPAMPELQARDPVGQMFMVDFTGTSPTPELERLIVEEGVGGVILFDKNIATPRQVAALTNAMQRLAVSSGRPPLLISADQEGGPVARLREGATHFPSAMAFGAAGSVALAASAAGVTARELRAVGVRMNMAPVLDVNTNPANPVIGVRSFGDTPALVARLGASAVRGLQAAGILATAKHFPGHGDTSLDSHLALPTVSHPWERIESVELAPFQAAVRAGVGAVMTAHVVFSALDPDHPATLSPAVLGLLRTHLGFEGLVVTDSMAMRAIAGRLAPGEAAVQAVLAGCDIILACGSVEAQREALLAVRRAVSAGRIPGERVAASASRILTAKQRLGLSVGATVKEEDVVGSVGPPEHQTVADRVAEAAATLVGDTPGVLPLAPGPVDVIPAHGLETTAHRLAGMMASVGCQAVVATGDQAVSQLARQGVAVVVLIDDGLEVDDDVATSDAGYAWMQRTVRAALSRGPTVVLSVGTPYGLAQVPSEAAAVAVYGSNPASLRAGARVLLGALRPRGRLPVSLGR